MLDDLNAHNSVLVQLVNNHPLERRQRSYHNERTGSRQISEVKHCRVSIVPGWVTAWEVEMLLAFNKVYFFHLRLSVKRKWRNRETRARRTRCFAVLIGIGIVIVTLDK